MHVYRTHTCGQLRGGDTGANVRLSGWIHRKRDHGGLVFVDLRDRKGITQIQLEPRDNAALGEQLKQLKEAGASRYLVRIETSNPELFSRIHPPEQSFSKRVSCLENIKAAGLQLGTGRLPSSTLNKALPCWNEEMQAGKCRHLCALAGLACIRQV